MAMYSPFNPPPPAPPRPPNERRDAAEAGPNCAIEEVKRWLERALAKFPTWPTDPLHAVAVLNEEVGELNKAVLQAVYEPEKNVRGLDAVREEAAQAGAMAIRFLQSLLGDKYSFRAGAQHKQMAAMRNETAAPPRPPADPAPGTLDSIGADALTTQVGGSHYKAMAIQPVEFIHRNRLGFCEGSAIKYLSRWRQKGGLQDLRKARHFIDLLIEMETQPATGRNDRGGG